MAAGKLNILIEQGATFNKTLTINGSTDTPLNLTGKTLRGSVRYKLQDAVSAADFSFIIQDQNTLPGVAIWNLTAAQTDLLTQSSAVYDIELVDGTTVTRILSGAVFISLSATR
jgi:hypothetical protein